MRVPKRPFVFSQRNTKFYSCTQTAIRFLQRNTKSRIAPKWPFFFFYNETQNLKFVPKRLIRISPKEIRNLTIYHQFSFVS